MLKNRCLFLIYVVVKFHIKFSINLLVLFLFFLNFKEYYNLFQYFFFHLNLINLALFVNYFLKYQSIFLMHSLYLKLY